MGQDMVRNQVGMGGISQQKRSWKAGLFFFLAFYNFQCIEAREAPEMQKKALTLCVMHFLN